MPDIAPKLLGVNYTAAEITAKLTELKTLKALNEAQDKEYGDQYKATETYTNAVTVLHKTTLTN